MKEATLALALALAPSGAWAQDSGVRDEEDGGAPAADGDAGADEAMAEMLEEAMKKVAEARVSQAEEHLARKDYPRALELYREAHDLDPENAGISNDLGYMYYLLGNLEEAERLYRRTLELSPDRFVAHLNLADLLLARGGGPERLVEAGELLVRAREIKGNRAKVILRQARVAALLGEHVEAERFYREYLARRKPDDRLRLEIGDFYRDLGRDHEALSWYRQIDDEVIGRQAAGRIWEIEVEDQARRFGWTRDAGSVSAKARRLASKGKGFLARHRYEDAERLLREALADAPAYAAARADLGDVCTETGRRAEAELQYLRALAVDHGNAEIHARLGRLHLSAPAQEKRSAEAALFLTRALDLRPDWSDLHLDLARALRAAGDLPGALRHVERYLAGANPGERRSEAVALEKALEDLVPPEGRIPASAEAGSPAEVRGAPSEELALAVGRARAHLSRGETDAAMAELRRLSEDERGTLVLNQEARILLATGRKDEAEETLRASLGIDPDQPVALEQLGSLLLEAEEPGEGRLHLLRAEELGSADATYQIALMDAGSEEAGILSWVRDALRIGDLLRSRDRLDRFLSGEGSTSVFADEAAALRDRVGDRLGALAAAAAAIVALLVAALLLAAVRVWGGSDLEGLIEHHPEAGPDVQRVLSAVRHEVLKHNTMMLSGIVEAIEREDDVSERASHFLGSILGEGGEGGVARRLPVYLGDLDKIARAHGLRLNLLRRDAAVSSMVKGFGILERSARDLARLGSLTSRRRSVLLRDLRTASRLLNEEGYEAIRALLDRLRALEVDETLLASVYERCRTEPSFAGARFGALDLDVRAGAPCRVSIPRQAFEDIMANLIRNAIQSSLEHGEGAVTIGLGADVEVDDTTGVERVVLMVRDRSRKVLTAEMLRGRYIEGGLGLTADLVSRYDGTLDVLPGGGEWSKTVVVKLPRADVVDDAEEGEER